MLTFKGSPDIETERLLLRKFTLSDTGAAFHHWLSDTRVADNRVSAPHKKWTETENRIAKIVKSYETTSFCYWAIELKVSGELIGEIDLYDFEEDTGNCEVGYSIGPSWWNQGYGTEALKAVMKFGFIEMNVHKISAAHNTDNPASGRIMRKAGMEKEGTIKHMIRNYKGEYKDCDVYGLLQEYYSRRGL
ncbi:ribosomal-protein-S5-alanine N-acetyltransferase [Bacillus sp. THAF10]|uniref:GNAT family N-acetyltransferase n=1 Tax=Bacillus sp. THAF10 TaxID=2587848 RepID=UPI0012682956|nr:GNAT family N-acetyltransferase [Bacillus sp. THAF10]QFT89681.1 ribosomal-protein-S5-alanine N-acetyltransferase [Bacillus sp. THAF10]